MDCKNQTNLYTNKVILAPMVRANSLPFRLLCLEAGADLVYSEELIDYALEKCQRLVNERLGTIDFVDHKGKVLFRTCPKERDRVVVQLGSNDPERALRAAKLVSNDVCGIDFNFGCPKSFSISGGMGAAMLEKPDDIRAILTKCVSNLDIPVTCKIRILPNLEKTLDLVKMIESCGVAAIAVHGRTKSERNCHSNNDEFLRRIAETISIPMIANGGSNNIACYSDMIKFRDSVNASSVMIARAAQKNPSIFKSAGCLEPIETVIEKFTRLAVEYDNTIHLTKYTIQKLLAGGTASDRKNVVLSAILGRHDWVK